MKGLTRYRSLMRLGQGCPGGGQRRAADKSLRLISSTERKKKYERATAKREGGRSESTRGQGGEGAQLTGASSGSGACFPEEVQED